MTDDAKPDFSGKSEADCSTNRFHIDVRSETFNVGDMEWAQILLTLNLVLQKQWPHVAAYLEELPNEKKVLYRAIKQHHDGIFPMLFWSCPNGCNGRVEWRLIKDVHVAKCVSCGCESIEES
jgi:hypothetical protein